ncbi:MAG: hypothetical protein U9Q05_13865 [Thermodesulfobacteriota bacterium]|nr:hypothetical protein [Thermodesulfobacteriota bacterium]
MKSLIDDLFSIAGVLGVLVVSSERNVVFQDLARLELDDFKEADLEMPLLLFDRVKEADLLFECYRIYIRKCPLGLLWVIMQPNVSAAMIRLQCDIIVPKMKQQKPVKRGIGRFFM